MWKLEQKSLPSPLLLSTPRTFSCQRWIPGPSEWNVLYWSPRFSDHKYPYCFFSLSPSSAICGATSEYGNQTENRWRRRREREKKEETREVLWKNSINSAAKTGPGFTPKELITWSYPDKQHSPNWESCLVKQIQSQTNYSYSPHIHTKNNPKLTKQ